MNTSDTAQAFPAELKVANLNGTDGFTVRGKSSWDLSGFSVSSVGDINGDGIDDFTLGTPYTDFNGIKSGSCYVIFGNPNGFPVNVDLSALNSVNGFKIDGKTDHDRVGFSVSGAGDVNGDGFDDLIIGAYYAFSSSTLYTGEAYVVFGTANIFPPAVNLNLLNGNNGFTIPGAGANHYLGRAVSGAGDVNGDGFDDIIVGSDGGPPYAGISYVIFGTNSFPIVFNLNNLNGNNGFAIKGDIAPYGNLGRSVSDAGDVNGDGINDVIIGMAKFDPNSLFPGKCYVVFGSVNSLPANINVNQLNGINGFAINGSLPGDELGLAVSGADDINADGISDIIVGAPGADPNGVSNAGKVYVIFGSANPFPNEINVGTLNGSNGFFIYGTTIEGRLGDAVSGVRDFNHDGIDDVIVGEPFSFFNLLKTGKSYVIFGTNTFSSSLKATALNGNNGFTIVGKEDGDTLGFSVSEAGDVNGDGAEDLIVGAIFANSPVLNCGQSFVIWVKAAPLRSLP